MRKSQVVLYGYWIFCFILTHIPPWVFPPGPEGLNDKVIHAGMFFGLGFLWGLNDSTRAPGSFKVILRSLLWIALYACVDEITQLAVEREADFFDFLADLGGALVGLLVSCFFKRLWARSRSIIA